MPHQPSYIGRFAPSPSGPLHFGSLVAALASYLDARKASGKWLVRIDDIDPPRETAGAAEDILNTLKAHHLHWDDDVFWQSQRADAYEQCLQTLTEQGLVYPCDCSRQDIKAMGGVYNGHCRQAYRVQPPSALRLKLYDLPEPLQALPDVLTFNDAIQGPQSQNLAIEVGDAIVKRKDALYGYQLAVVLDDLKQGITHIVRGADLLPVTARQIRFFEIIGQRPPEYAHIPVAAREGRKLSKQNHAQALDCGKVTENLWQALVFLGQNPPVTLRSGTADPLLNWAIERWSTEPLRHLGLTQAVTD